MCAVTMFVFDIYCGSSTVSTGVQHDSDSEYEDEDDVFGSIPDLAAELDFERVEADIDYEVEVFIHMDPESTGNSSDGDRLSDES